MSHSKTSGVCILDGVSYTSARRPDGTLLLTPMLLTPIDGSKIGKAFIILGMQWGDEGKGKLIEYLIRKCIKESGKVVVVRFGGASNCGHTIIDDEKVLKGSKVATHQLPSGIYPECINVIGNGTLVDLRVLFEEMETLAKQGFDYTGRLFVSLGCHLTCLIHRLIDEGKGGKVGSTKRGVSPTVASKAMRIGIRICDLMGPDWEDKIRTLYSEEFNRIPDEFQFEIKYPEKKVFTDIECMLNYEIEYIRSVLSKLIPMVRDTGEYLRSLDSSCDVIFEGAQSVLLDPDSGTYPYTTATSCNIGGIYSGASVSPDFFKSRYTEIVGVAKASYITRVGNGCLPTEDTGEIGSALQRIGQEVGVTSGRKRRCGHPDLVALKHAVKISGTNCLCVTKCDVSGEGDFKTIQVCVEYAGGPPVFFDERMLSKAQPEYKTFDNWNGVDVSQFETFETLDSRIKTFFEFIEEQIGIPIKYVSTGRGRDDFFERSEICN